ncbi:transposase [Castellaniella caeni]|uniref:transposase n=1 Tax=Castellaniella caeni TaxID=266123 RepID=UPI0009FCCF1B|nr:transposase [Castellaniella caeni]
MRQDEPGGRTRQRSYNRACKTRVLRECAQPGATVSSAAHAHGMNTNNIYRWRRQVARGELKLVGAAARVQQLASQAADLYKAALQMCLYRFT